MVPAAQASAARHDDWLAFVEMRPAAQMLQTRSAIPVPMRLTNEPGSHESQGVHCAEFAPELKLPLGQVVHMRSVVEEPVVPTNWPAWQAVHATHAVEAF